MSFDDVLRQIVSRAVGPPGQGAPLPLRPPNTLGSSTPMPPSAAELALAEILTSAYANPNTLGSSAPLPPAPTDPTIGYATPPEVLDRRPAPNTADALMLQLRNEAARPRPRRPACPTCVGHLPRPAWRR